MKKSNAKLKFELKDGQIYEFDVFWNKNSLVESLSNKLNEKVVNRVYFSDEFKYFFEIGIKEKIVYLNHQPYLKSKVYFEDTMGVLSSEISPDY
jgi:hypothetical protein